MSSVIVFREEALTNIGATVQDIRQEILGDTSSNINNLNDTVDSLKDFKLNVQNQINTINASISALNTTLKAVETNILKLAVSGSGSSSTTLEGMGSATSNTTAILVDLSPYLCQAFDSANSVFKYAVNDTVHILTLELKLSTALKNYFSSGYINISSPVIARARMPQALLTDLSKASGGKFEVAAQDAQNSAIALQFDKDDKLGFFTFKNPTALRVNSGNKSNNVLKFTYTWNASGSALTFGSAPALCEAKDSVKDISKMNDNTFIYNYVQVIGVSNSVNADFTTAAETAYGWIINVYRPAWSWHWTDNSYVKYEVKESKHTLTIKTYVDKSETNMTYRLQHKYNDYLWANNLISSWDSRALQDIKAFTNGADKLFSGKWCGADVENLIKLTKDGAIMPNGEHYLTLSGLDNVIIDAVISWNSYGTAFNNTLIPAGAADKVDNRTWTSVKLENQIKVAESGTSSGSSGSSGGQGAMYNGVGNPGYSFVPVDPNNPQEEQTITDDIPKNYPNNAVNSVISDLIFSDVVDEPQQDDPEPEPIDEPTPTTTPTPQQDEPTPTPTPEPDPDDVDFGDLLF